MSNYRSVQLLASLVSGCQLPFVLLVRRTPLGFRSWSCVVVCLDKVILSSLFIMAQRNPSRPLPVVKNQFRPVSDWVGHISDVTSCPFNPGHVMRLHKLISHLPKCEKKNGQLRKEEATPQQEMERCPYNSLHVYPAGKQGEHFQKCKARAEELMARYMSGESIKDVDSRYSFKDKDVE